MRLVDETCCKYTPNTGVISENDHIECGVCGMTMNVDRNCFGPRCMAEAMQKIGSHYDKFVCPCADNEWHKRVVDIRNEIKQTASLKLQNLLQSEVNELIEHNMSPIFNPSQNS